MMLEDMAIIIAAIAIMFALAVGHIILKLDRIEHDLLDVKYYGTTFITDGGDESE